MTTSSIRVSGPLWDGEASAAVAEWIRVTKKDVADRGKEEIVLRYNQMDRSGRATGAHAGSISVRAQGADQVVQGDSTSGAIWWPWLEGTSHRNTTTGFGGYHVFRKTRLKMRKTYVALAQEELEKFIGRMGGR